jgi:hypothetical protein
MSSEFDINHWFEAQGKLHIGCTTGVPGRWIAHTLCGRRIWNWIGFGFDSLHYAKTDKICTDCAAMWLQHYLEKCNLTKKRLSVVTENKTEGT